MDVNTTLQLSINGNPLGMPILSGRRDRLPAHSAIDASEEPLTPAGLVQHCRVEWVDLQVPERSVLGPTAQYRPVLPPITAFPNTTARNCQRIEERLIGGILDDSFHYPPARSGDGTPLGKEVRIGLQLRPAPLPHPNALRQSGPLPAEFYATKPRQDASRRMYFCVKFSRSKLRCRDQRISRLEPV